MLLLKLIGLVLAVIIVLLIIAIIRTLLLEKKTTYYEYSKDKKRSMEYGKKLSKMIQVETVSHRDDPEVKKFRGFHKTLKELFPNVFKKCQKIEIDGNIMMKWKGQDPTLDPIILISHIDVVPAEGNWTYPPFSGKITKDMRIYGRGTGDIKCGVFSFYQAAEELIKQGYTPKCDVYLGSSCTEEIGGNGAPKMVNWFKEHGIHLFMLSDEGGGITRDPVAGIKGTFAAIGVFEKGYGDLKFSAKSNGGHSSTPPKNTPIARLAAFENEIENHSPFKAKMSVALEAMLNGLAPYSDNFWLRLVMHNTWLFSPVLKIVLPMISTEAGAMLKTTCAFTMQKGSNGYNVIPQEAWVTGNLRYIPHEPLEASNKKISEIAKKYDIDTEVVLATPHSKALDLNGDPYKMTVKCINKIFPGIGIMPYVVTGGTDSRFYDPVCDNCVRFSPICTEPDQMKSMHAIDENIFITTLPQAVDYYKELIKIQETR
ncbi:MAG: M20/M25/M40 family metallo-hydrolase [Erysipelotrichaceae bacterium]|nr:M20/M25/M40 family metallo-hydrolase [Erysipelotrichaceae bacterium]